MLNQGIKEINQLNKEFYEIHNESFDKSRKDNYWEGFLNTLKYLNIESKVLDLGCGNARFLNFLLENKLKPNYLGVDNSEEFIIRDLAKYPDFRFKVCDVVSNLEEIQDKFDLIAVYGVTHHLPNKEFRKNWFNKLKYLCQQNGVIILSFWNFDISKSDENFKPTYYQIEDEDYFLGWKKDYSIHRYCHLYNELEIAGIKEIFEDFKVLEDFELDSNRYLILKKGR